MQKYCIVISTFESKQQAQSVIDQVLIEKLAACVQVIDIKSHYIWQGDVCHDDEVLVMFKTAAALYERLEQRIRALHSYETPEIIAIDVCG